jgi:hypothetical protein
MRSPSAGAAARRNQALPEQPRRRSASRAHVALRRGLADARRGSSRGPAESRGPTLRSRRSAPGTPQILPVATGGLRFSERRTSRSAYSRRSLSGLDERRVLRRAMEEPLARRTLDAADRLAHGRLRAMPLHRGAGHAAFGRDHQEDARSPLRSRPRSCISIGNVKAVIITLTLGSGFPSTTVSGGE